MAVWVPGCSKIPSSLKSLKGGASRGWRKRRNPRPSGYLQSLVDENDDDDDDDEDDDEVDDELDGEEEVEEEGEDDGRVGDEGGWGIDVHTDGMYS